MASSSSGAVATPGRGAVFVGSRRLCCEGLSSLPMGRQHAGCPRVRGQLRRAPALWRRPAAAPPRAQRCPRPAWRFSVWSWESGELGWLMAFSVSVCLSATFCLSRRPSPVLLDVLCLVAVRRRPPSHAALPCVQVCSASACKARPLSERAGTRRTHWRTRWPRR